MTTLTYRLLLKSNKASIDAVSILACHILK